MLLVPCLACNTVVRVIGDPDATEGLVGDKSEFWPNKYTCVSCSGACEGVPEYDAEAAALAAMSVVELTPEEYFAALMGLGTPEEAACSAAVVRDLFVQKVVRVVVEDVPGTTRSTIQMLEFEDGRRLYLGASPHGAVVYRIVLPVSYTRKALEAFKAIS